VIQGAAADALSFPTLTGVLRLVDGSSSFADLDSHVILILPMDSLSLLTKQKLPMSFSIRKRWFGPLNNTFLADLL